MARGVKFVVAGGEVRSKKVAAEEKGKRAALRTREAMDFDPKLCSAWPEGGGRVYGVVRCTFAFQN